jgi:hypothetical protein
MAIAFRVTYDIVTEDSAADGDVAESGYYSRGGWKHDDPSDWTLHEVVSQFGRNSLEDVGSWFSSYSPDINYRTGEDTSYSVHPPRTITRASYARLRRILSYREGRR